MIPPLTRIGRISAKHGFKGEVSIAPDDASLINNIKKGNFLFIEFDGKGVPFLIENCSAGGLVVKLSDIDSEQAAKEIIGASVLLEKTKVKKSKAPGFDHLTGFSIRDTETDFTALITKIEIYPQGPMLEVLSMDKTFLIPLVEAWIKEIDEDNRCISMQLPDGLTEI
jgi:16S rRNA processing protein RimM